MLYWYIVTAIITIIYFLTIASFLVGWQKNEEYQGREFSPSDIILSVIIALRNEEHNIDALVASMIKQTLDPSKFEIIMVDDHSSDSTLSILKSRTAEFKQFQFYTLVGPSGKKSAILHGISLSKGQLIVTTDADCTHHPDWLIEIYSYYNQFKPKMILGPVLMKYQSFFDKIQALDFFSLMISGAGACGLKKPIMCNAANLAYEKGLIDELINPMNSGLVSGDDIFMMLNVKKKYPGKIHFLKSKKSVVYTNPEKGLRQFLAQRKRWASKSLAYKDKDLIIVALTVFVTNFLLFTNLIMSVSDMRFVFLFAMQFLLKGLIDYFLLSKTLVFFRQTKLLKYFLPAWFFNFLYIPITAVTGIMNKPKWKGKF